MRKRIILNAGSSWINVGVVSVVGIVLVPIMLNRLGTTAYGVWALLTTGLNYPIIFQQAFGLAINRTVAYYHDDVHRVNRVVSVSFFVLLGMGVLCILASIILSFFLTDIFESIPHEMAADARLTCVLVGFTLALNMLQANFSGVLMGFQSYTVSNAVSSATMILRAGLTVVMLSFWRSTASVQLAFLISVALSTAIMFAAVRKAVPGFRVNWRAIDRKSAFELFHYTIHSIARSGSTILMETTLTFLIGFFGTAADVTIFNVASRIPAVLRGLFASAQHVFLPAVTSLAAKGEMATIRGIVKRGTLMSAVLTCGTCLLVWVFTEDLLRVWLKGAVPLETVTVMRVLLISLVPRGIFELWLPVLVGIGHLRWLSIVSMTAAIVAIPVDMVLVRVVPAALAPAIVLTGILWIKSGIWMPIYGIQKTGIRLYEYFRGGLLWPLLATVIAVGLLWIINSSLRSNMPSWLIVLAIDTMLVGGVFAALCLRREIGEALVVVKHRRRMATEGAA